MIKTGGTLLLGIAVGMVVMLFLRSGDMDPQARDGLPAQVRADGSTSESSTASEDEALRQRVADLEVQIADLLDTRDRTVAVPPASPSESVDPSVDQSGRRRRLARNLDSMPAIPSYADFEIDLQYVGLYENGFTAPELLAAEPRDDQWAPGTESFLQSEVLGATSAPMTTVQTECRTTWCGVVIEVPESLPLEDIRAMYLHIMESVGSDESVSRDYTFGRPNEPGGHIVFYVRVDR